MDIPQFRLDFPQFSDESIYTDSMCAFWSASGERLNCPSIFGDDYNLLIELYTAHNISIQAKEIFTSSTGGVPQGDPGAITSKKQGPVEYQFDSVSASILGAGIYNQTWYGRQYWQLRSVYTKGGLQF